MRRQWRQLVRHRDHEARHARYYAKGLNGERAVARRRRQIESGNCGVRHSAIMFGVGASLRPQNGLVS